MPKRQHPELEGYESQPLYTFELKDRRKTRRDRILLGLGSLLIGASGAAVVHLLWPFSWLQSAFAWVPPSLEQLTPDDPSTVSAPNAFDLGRGKAMNAAELTQVAKYKEDWVAISLLWQAAIAHMQAVPKLNEHYTLAQQKATEYQRNLQYALSNVRTRSPKDPYINQFWTLGSDRDLVVNLQGTPTQISRYDSLCQEILYYGNSQVTLENGYVTEYNNFDNNLRVLLDGELTTSNPVQQDSWILGATREEVLRVQGSPGRLSGYKTLGAETLFYGNSFVQLEDGRVVGYFNLDNNLKIALGQSAKAVPAKGQMWTLGSSRSEVLNLQEQIPTSVYRQNILCEETFRYGESTVLFRHGVVVGYQNHDQNLRVR